MMLSLLTSFSLTAQTFLYDFSTTPVMKFNAGSSGLAVGSVWVYTKIDAAATTDAVVTISASSGGITLSTFDAGSSNGGYDKAFQPGLNVPGTGGSGTVSGYVEFTFTFITTGTYNAATKNGTPRIQTALVPATILDDDGTLTGGTLHEFDMLNLGSGELLDYSTTGPELSYSTSGTNITGTNAAGTNYSGISATAYPVMFTVINQNISTMVYRTGVTSNFSTAPASRVTSLAFFMPSYPSAVLAVSTLSEFQGTVTHNGIDLQWQLADERSVTELSLERSVDGGAFLPLRNYTPDNTGRESQPVSFSYNDNTSQLTTVAYRIKMVEVSGSTQYSKVLNFDMTSGSQEICRIYPTLISSLATLELSSERAATGVLRIIDYEGHTVGQQPITLGKGINYLSINRPSGLPAGNYIASVRIPGHNYTQKIILAPQ